MTENVTDGSVTEVVAKDLNNDENVTSIYKNVTKNGSGSKVPMTDHVPSQPPTYADVVRRIKRVSFESEMKPLLPLTFKR